MTSSIEECIYDVLDNDARLATQVDERISPAYRPGETILPCVVYEIGALVSIPILSGTVSPQVTGEFTVTVYATSVLGSVNAADAVLEALDGTSGTLDETDYAFRFTTAGYDYDPPIDGDETGTYSRALSFSFMKDSGDL